MGRDADGRYVERWVGADEPCDLTWSRTHVLQLVHPHEAHTVSGSRVPGRGMRRTKRAPRRRHRVGDGPAALCEVSWNHTPTSCQPLPCEALMGFCEREPPCEQRAARDGRLAAEITDREQVIERRNPSRSDDGNAGCQNLCQ